MAKFIEVHKGDAPYLLNLDDISSITAFGGETCFWHQDGDSSVYDDSFDTVRLMIGAAQGGIPTIMRCKMDLEDETHDN